MRPVVPDSEMSCSTENRSRHTSELRNCQQHRNPYPTLGGKRLPQYAFKVPRGETHAYDPSHALDLDDASKMNQMHEAPLLDLLLRRFRQVRLLAMDDLRKSCRLLHVF